MAENHSVFKQGLYPFLEKKAIAIRESMIDVQEAFDTNYPDLVLYDGKFPSQIFFVGRDLGKDEVIQKRPFIGSAGKLLRRSMKVSGIDEDSVFITNVVPYKPYNNEVFPPNVRSIFGSLVDLEIKIGKPKYVICVGKEAIESVLKKEIKSVLSFCKSNFAVPLSLPTFGGVHNFEIVPMPHPSYYLRNGVTENNLTENTEFMDLVVEKLKKVNSLVNKETIDVVSHGNERHYIDSLLISEFAYHKEEGKPPERKFVLVLDGDDKNILAVDLSLIPKEYVDALQKSNEFFSSDIIKTAFRKYSKSKIKRIL